jgi:hypothetical protein
VAWREDDPFLARTVVRGYACPHCGAQPGENCIGVREKVRESNHQERVTVAERAHGIVRPPRGAG